MLGRLYISDDDDDFREYPQRNLLYLADRYLLAITSFVLCFGSWIVVARATLDPQKDAAFADLRTWIWVVIGLTICRGLTFYLRDHNEKIARIYKTTQLKGLQGLVALVMACWLIYIIESHNLPGSLAAFVWPVFMVGLIIGVQRLSKRQKFNNLSPLSLTRLSWLAILYTLIAVYAMAFPARQAGLAHFVLAFLATTQYFPTSGAFWREAGALVVPLLPSLVTGTMLLTVYYALRRSDIARVQNDLLARLFEALARIEDDSGNTWQTIASLIQRRLGYHRVFILIPDEHYRDAMAARTAKERQDILSRCNMHVAGGAGAGADQVTYKEFPITSGLAQHCVETGQHILRTDVQKLSEPAYMDGGLKDTVAELQVPIRDVNRSDVVLFGILVVQEVKQNYLTQRDVQTLRRVCNFLANYSHIFDGLWSKRGIDEEVEEAISQEPSALLGIMQVLKRVCKSSSMAFVPLGFATRYPMTDRITTLTGGFDAPEQLTNVDLFRSDSPLLTSMKAWQPLFFGLDKASPQPSELPEAWRTWMEQEGLHAIAILPVGDAKHPHGLFLVGFSKLTKGVWSEMRQALTAFGQIATRHLRYSDIRLNLYQQTFITQSVNLHGFLNAEDLGRTALPGRLENIHEASKTQVVELGMRLLRVVKRLHEAEEMRPPHPHNPSLESSLTQFRAAIRVGRDPEIALEWRLDPRLEMESLELKVILYRCIAEAVFNSLNHGRATKIEVRVARLQNQIWLVVADNGRGFDAAQPANRVSKTHTSGIIHMTDRIKELSGASDIDWAWTTPNVGTCLKMMIPMPPEPALPEAMVVKDHLDCLEQRHVKKTDSIQ